MQFIGIVLHTNCFTACFLNETGEKSIYSFSIYSEGISSFINKVENDSYSIVEARINSFCFLNPIKSDVKQVIVANTLELKTISFTNKKTDKVDAYKLARVIKSQILSGSSCCYSTNAYPEFKITFYNLQVRKKAGNFC